MKVSNNSQAGFTYVDVMIAMVILLVGVLALMSAISAAILQSRGQERQLTAKQIATSTMESIMSVKETDPVRFGWKAVGNVGTNPDANGINQGVFLNGEQAVLADPGVDEVIGTGDDSGAQVGGFTREIVIRDQCDPERPSANCAVPGDLPVRIRTVEVRVNFYIGAIRQQERIATVLTDYSIIQ